MQSSVQGAGRIAWLAGLIAALAGAGPALAETALFSQRNFQGQIYALRAETPMMAFSPRSARVLPDQPWELCPRAFFGGQCIVVSGPQQQLSLPRRFSGVVRSARPLKGDPAAAPTPQPAPKPAQPAKPAQPSAPETPKAEAPRPEAARPTDAPKPPSR